MGIQHCGHRLDSVNFLVVGVDVGVGSTARCVGVGVGVGLGVCFDVGEGAGAGAASGFGVGAGVGEGVGAGAASGFGTSFINVGRSYGIGSIFDMIYPKCPIVTIAPASARDLRNSRLPIFTDTPIAYYACYLP